VSKSRVSRRARELVKPTVLMAPVAMDSAPPLSSVPAGSDLSSPAGVFNPHPGESTEPAIIRAASRKEARATRVDLFMENLAWTKA
jgi:hypothetical protein